MEEREITKVATCNLTKLQKMALQWKIAVDFKPTASVGLNLYTPYTPLLIVTFGVGGDFELRLQYRKDNIALMLFDPRKPRQPSLWKLKSTEVPKVGEWTRIEISHEEAEDKFYLGLTVGGALLGRREAHPKLQRMKSVTATFGGDQALCGFFRSLVVLEK